MSNNTDHKDLLRGLGYEESLLATMSDSECEAEIQEVPYNA